MYHDIKILNQTANGCLRHCSQCQTYQLTFGNFMLELSREEFRHFSVFLDTLDVEQWESYYAGCDTITKIPIPTMQSNLLLILNVAELEELQRLLFYKESQVNYLNATEINVGHSLN